MNITQTEWEDRKAKLSSALVIGTNVVRCDDLPTSREWLRMLATNLALVRSWRVMVVVIAHLLVHVADVVAVVRRGRTSVLYPRITGGADHSLRAVRASANPMVFHGDFTSGAACAVRHRKRAPVAVMWAVPRRRVLTSVRVSSRGVIATYDPTGAT